MRLTTKLRTKRGEFISLDEAMLSPKRLQYRGAFEGAICLDVDGTVLLSEAEWDIVDMLWTEVVDGVEAVKKSGEWSGSFPDQDLRLSFKKMGGEVEIRLCASTRLPRAVRCDLRALRYQVLVEADRAFRAFQALAPQNKYSGYQTYLYRIQRLLNEEP